MNRTWKSEENKKGKRIQKGGKRKLVSWKKESKNKAGNLE
jgi:hypothetical protein